jgi:hypothetical protein
MGVKYVGVKLPGRLPPLCLSAANPAYRHLDDQRAEQVLRLQIIQRLIDLHQLQFLRYGRLSACPALSFWRPTSYPFFKSWISRLTARSFFFQARDDCKLGPYSWRPPPYLKLNMVLIYV